MLHRGGNELTYIMVKSSSFPWPLPELSNVGRLSWKNGIHLFPAFPSNQKPLPNKWAMYTSYGGERWKKYMLPDHRVLLCLFFDRRLSRILCSCSFSSLRSQGKCLIPWGFAPDINKTFAQPRDSLYACYAFISSVALFPSEIILLTGCLYVMSIFPSLTSMWAHGERGHSSIIVTTVSPEQRVAWQVVSTWWKDVEMMARCIIVSWKTKI